MKIIKYTYKFKLNPTDDQKILLNKHFGSVRWTYNYFLNQRKEEYLNNKKSLNYYDQAAELTLLAQNHLELPYPSFPNLISIVPRLEFRNNSKASFQVVATGFFISCSFIGTILVT